MGRALHFSVKPDKPFTDTQIDKMYEISMKFNSGKFKDVWTCENFWCDPCNYYPNWDDPKGIYKEVKDGEHWEIIDKRYSELFNVNRSRAKTSRQLEKEGYIQFYNSNPRKESHGFCKVQGNEYNSLLVLLALVEISEAIPKADIRVNDEGEFLLCEIKLRNGKACPDLREMKSDVLRYAGYTLLSKPHFLKKLKEVKGLDKTIATDLGIGNSYGEMQLEYIDETLRNLKLVLSRIVPVYEKRKENQGGRFGSSPACIHNLMNPPGYDPFLLTRADQLDIQKFANYKMTPDTMMDGFRGEGFGLADPENAVKLAQNMTAMIKKAVGDEGKLQVLGE